MCQLSWIDQETSVIELELYNCFERVKVYFTFYLFHDNSRNQTILRKKSTNEYLNGQKKRTFKSFNFLLFFRVFIYLMHLNYEGWKMSCQQNK